MNDLMKLSEADGGREWRTNLNQQLGNIIQKRLYYLQVLYFLSEELNKIF